MLDKKQLEKMREEEILKYLFDNPDEETAILDILKNNPKTKKIFFRVSSDLKSANLNTRGAAAVRKNTIETLIDGKDVISIKIDLIKPNPSQPRKSWNDENLEELSESIKQYGLIQPIVVYKNQDDIYTLIAGERRLKAHKLANINEIKAIVLETTEIEARKLALIENIQRADLTPLEEGLAYKEIQKEGGYSLRDMEEVVQKKKNYIAARLKLTTFNEDCIDFIFKHRITNINKLLKILETEPAIHKTLLEKLSKGELTDIDIENFMPKKIQEFPDEKLSKNISSKSERIKEVRQSNNSYIVDSFEEIENTILQETKAIKIIGNRAKKINITIDIQNVTGADLTTLKEFLETI